MINTIILFLIFVVLISKPIYNSLEISNEIKKINLLEIKNLKINKTLYSVKIEYYNLVFSVRKKDFNSETIIKMINKYSPTENPTGKTKTIITVKGIYDYND